MIKNITLSIVTLSTLSLGVSNRELQDQIDEMKVMLQSYKQQNRQEDESLIEDDLLEEDTPISVSGLGLSASKVYHSNALSIGGYAELKAKKYTRFKNFSNPINNQTRKKLETNVVRFVPYFGYKFNDWIVMNTEIEFEDGGARSDNSKNYKYAIVEFSYVDFMLDEKYNIRVGHILVPFGSVNLNHEPVAYLTNERPLVETFVIPSTWHTNGALVYGNYDDFHYYGGVITSVDAGTFTQGRFIQQGRLGAKQFTNDFSGVTRINYKGFNGIEIGSSFLYGKSSVLAQTKAGSSINPLKASISLFMGEIHASYKNNGWNINALATMGKLGDEYKKLNTTTSTISGLVNGQYLTLGYDFLHRLNTQQKLFGVVEVERLDLDANNETTHPDNFKFNEYTLGFSYFPDPKVVLKGEYNLKDYAHNSQFADEEAMTFSLGYIF